LAVARYTACVFHPSDGYAHDYPFFKGLLDRTADAGFKMREVSADKGYLGADNMLATLQKGAIPYIPFETNLVPQSGYEPKSQLWTRMYHFYALHRAEFLWHYHKRSNIETTCVRQVLDTALLRRLPFSLSLENLKPY